VSAQIVLQCAVCGEKFSAWRYRARAARFCSTRCYDEARATAAEERAIHRFWTRVNKYGPTPAHCPELGPCWLWTGSFVTGGYGAFWHAGRSTTAPRFAWLLAHGPIPKGQSVLHRCDNPPCCNAERHLYLGTVVENVRDMHARGREARAERHGRRTKPDLTARGSGHGCAVLTEGDVLQIREEYAQGAMQLDLAGRFDVERSTIGAIVRRKTWRHI